jgi:hypothetical protein
MFVAQNVNKNRSIRNISVELLFFDFHSSGTPKVVNVSPKGFHPPLVGVLADLTLLTDGNEKPTVYNTITKP